MIAILEIVKNFIKTLSIRDYIFLAIIVTLSILFLRSYFHINDNVITVLPVLTPTTQQTDKKGTQYTEIKGTIYTQAQMKVITDSIQRVLGKGKVVQVTRTVTKIDTVYTTNNVYVDTATGIIIASDSNRDVKQSFTGNYRTHTGSFGLHLTPDTCTSITTIKRRLFKGPEMTTNLYHTNKLFTPILGYSYTVQPAYDKFKLDGYIGCQTEFSRFYVAAGLVGQYFVTRRTSVGISYQYLYDGTAFTKSLTGRLRYTLIRF